MLKLTSARLDLRQFERREGEVLLPGVYGLRVTAALEEAQLIESAILNLINFPTLIATKAARIRSSARGRPLLEFGLRRAQGQAHLLASVQADPGGAN